MNAERSNNARERESAGAEQGESIAELQELHSRIKGSDTFRANREWGQERPGHPEGSLGAHIEMLHENLTELFSNPHTEILKRMLSPEQVKKVEILIDAHDIMKPAARRGVAIEHRDNHASLAARWLTEMGAPNELAIMAQLHDMGHALYRQANRTETVDTPRLNRLLYSISDWDTFLTFQICDKVCSGRDLESTSWMVDRLREAGVQFSVPAEAMIETLAARHGLAKSAPGNGAEETAMKQIVLGDLPSMREIQAIETREQFDSWVTRLREEILQNRERFYHTEGVTERFLVLSRDPADNFAEICDYASFPVEDSALVDWPVLAIAVREKVQS
jgi:hypothetical protein